MIQEIYHGRCAPGVHSCPLLFLIYMNDLPNTSEVFECILFVDDIDLFSKID